MIDLAILGLAVAVALVGGWVTLNGFSPVRWRRLASGVAFLAVAGLAMWVRVGGTLPLPRAVTIVFTDAATAADLADAAARVGSSDQVCWLRLVPLTLPKSGEPTSSPVYQWLPSAAVTRRPGELDNEYLSRVRAVSAPVSVGGDNWFKALADADSTARKAVSTWFSALVQDTVLVVVDRGKMWAGLPIGTLNLDDAAALSRPSRDLFVLRSSVEARVGNLKIDLIPEVLPAGPIQDLGSARGIVRLLGAPKFPGSGVKYTLRAWIDGGPDVDHLPHFALPERELADPSEKIGRFSLADFQPIRNASRLLAPGFHRLLVRLSVQLQGMAGKIEYEATEYVQVEPQRLIVLSRPPNPLGQLAADSWQPEALGLVKGPSTESPGTVLAKFLETRGDVRRDGVGVGQASRTGLSAASVHELPYSADFSQLKELDAAKVLVLVEPTVAELATLEKEPVNLSGRIDAGLTVLVIGPPVHDPKEWPAWLGWESEPATKEGGQPKLVYQDRRVYFVPDCARLMQFPTHDSSGALTGLTAQRDVMNHLAMALMAQYPVSSSPGPIAQVVKNQFLALDGENHTRFGKLVSPAPAMSLPVRLFPLWSRYVAKPDLPKDMDQQAREIFLWETAASFLPARLHALESRTEFDRLDPNHNYPGTTVVLFVADLPQPAAIPENRGPTSQLMLTATADGGLLVPGDNGVDREIVKRLVHRGVTVCMIRIKFPRGHELSLRAAARAAAFPMEEVDDYLKVGDDFANRIKELPSLDFSASASTANASVEAVKQALAKWIHDQPTADLKLESGGRVVDDRVVKKRPAPHIHRVLKATDQTKDRNKDRWGPPHAVIHDSRQPDDFIAIASQRVGRGRVVVSAYSPFAADVWQGDAGKGYLPEGMPTVDNPPEPDGWGVQRLLDLFDLTAAPRAVPSEHPIIRSVAVADDGATLRINCWADFRVRHLQFPELWDDRGSVALAKARLVALDRGAGTVSFELRNPGPATWQGFNYRINLKKTGEAADLADSSEARPRLFINLVPGGGAGRSLREALDRVAAVSGGRTLPHAIPGKALTADSLIGPFHRPAGWFAGFGIIVVLILGFVSRPWAWFRKASGKGPAGEADRQAARFDVDAVLTEWGLNPGIPRSARQAGLPAGQKEYESGDPLTTARPATLFPFAGGGHILPARRPVVRRRLVVRAMEAVILLDHSPGLLATGVGGYTRLVIRLLAGAVWQAAGSIRVVPAGPFDPWGPRSAGDDDAAGLEQYLTTTAARPSAARLAVPGDLEPGHVLFVVSDLLAFREGDLPEMLSWCNQEGIDGRVILIQAHPDPQAGAPAVSDVTGNMIDRAEWTAEDVSAAQKAHAEQSRRIVEAAGGRFVDINANNNAQDVFDRLVAAEFFS